METVSSAITWVVMVRKVMSTRKILLNGVIDFVIILDIPGTLFMDGKVHSLGQQEPDNKPKHLPLLEGTKLETLHAVSD
jgi:hypothetical protein